MAGDESEVLLVLASLNLDKMLDENDVTRYPDFYLRESGLQFPDKKISALVWIKIQIWGLIECDDVQKAEHLLYGFATKSRLPYAILRKNVSLLQLALLPSV